MQVNRLYDYHVSVVRVTGTRPCNTIVKTLRIHEQ